MVKGRQWTALLMVVALALCACMPVSFAVEAPEAYILNNEGRPMTSGAFLIRLSGELAQSGVDGEYGTLSLDDSPVDSQEYVATGQTLDIYTGADVLVGTRPVAVMGDVVGTGMASLSQLARLAAAFSGVDPLEGVFLVAGDLNGTGAIDLSDLVMATGQYRNLQDSETVELTSKTVPFYWGTLDDISELTVHFADKEQQIPYLSEDDAAALFQDVLAVVDGKMGVATITTSSENGLARWTRENGSLAEIDFLGSILWFDGYNEFSQASFASTALDPVEGPGINEDGELRFISRPGGSFQRDGDPVTINLAAYGIDLYYVDGTGYLPLQTFSDFFTSAHAGSLVYNGLMAGIQWIGYFDGLQDVWFDAPTGMRSAELCEFTYNELCLVCDAMYGLKEQHDIYSFDLLCEQIGIKEDLLSPDPAVADTALCTLLVSYLGDLHSQYLSNSFYTGQDVCIEPTEATPAWTQLFSNMDLYQNERTKFYPEGVPGYEEVGNTAYVTFDVFTLPASDVDYYENPPGPDATDTLGIILYAHSQITREDSPIENVVIDLSLNLGGAMSAAVFVLGWYLGDEAALVLNDTFTGAQCYTRYGVDVNLDGQVDKNDTIADKNLYCVISPVSLSDGNLAPAMFKASGKVSIVGRKSGGGACVVRPLTLADGTSFQISGPWRMSLMQNGAFYDVDKGIEPDYVISHVRDFYNRDTLTEYLNGLYR